MELPEGILLIDKPSGMTSFDVIRILQRLFRQKKMGHARTLTFELRKRGANDGVSFEACLTPALDVCFEKYIEERPSTQKLVCGHAGTLDPLATGLMVLGVGKGTKELANLVKLDKEYVAEILVGETRTTGDMEGEVIAEKEVTEAFSDEQVTAVLESMLGTLTLPVSAYSAIKVDGKPMYKRARAAAARGEVVEEVPVREMQVHEAELIRTESITHGGSDRQVVTVRFFIGSGTYIRSLAEEFGKRLGDYPATLYSLRRTKVGEFDIKDAHPLKAV